MILLFYIVSNVTKKIVKDHVYNESDKIRFEHSVMRFFDHLNNDIIVHILTSRRKRSLNLANDDYVIMFDKDDL